MAGLALDQRGEWAVNDEHAHAKVFGHRFLERLGGAFDGFQGSSWWFGFWGLFKAISVCLILAMVFAPAFNAALVLVMQCIDCAIMWFMFPDAQWAQFIQNTYKASVNIAIISAILAHAQGHIPDGLYTAMFQILAVVSIIVCAPPELRLWCIFKKAAVEPLLQSRSCLHHPEPTCYLCSRRLVGC
eukprot:2146865-Rhodomonas_salina.1